jgi:hypothetical protein
MDGYSHDTGWVSYDAQWSGQGSDGGHDAWQPQWPAAEAQADTYAWWWWPYGDGSDGGSWSVPTDAPPAPAPVDSAPAPADVAPAPAPVDVAPAPAPVDVAPAPAPVDVAPAPAPVDVAPAPAPVDMAPAPAPVDVAPAPTPVDVAPAPAPADVAPAPAPAPVDVAPAPAPVEVAPAPAVPTTSFGEFVVPGQIDLDLSVPPSTQQLDVEGTGRLHGITVGNGIAGVSTTVRGSLNTGSWDVRTDVSALGAVSRVGFNSENGAYIGFGLGGTVAVPGVGSVGVFVGQEVYGAGRLNTASLSFGFGPFGTSVSISGPMTPFGPVAPTAFTDVAPTFAEMNEVDPRTGMPAFANAFEAKSALQIDAANAAALAAANPAPTGFSPTPDQIAAAVAAGLDASFAERDGVPQAALSDEQRADIAHSAALDAQETADRAPESAPPDTAPADTAPADTVPGDTAPGDTGPGDTGPGDTGPGDTGPGDTGPGDTGPGDTGPGDTGPGDTGPGDTGPGDTGPGDTGPGDTGPGDTGPGDTGPGDTGPGDTGPGDTGPGDTGPGDAGSGGDDGGSGDGGGDAGGDSGGDGGESGGDSGGGDGGGGDGGGDGGGGDGGGGSEPVILDLDGDGLDLVTLDRSTAAFDMDGDGRRERTAWAGPDDALLVIDADGDGAISETRELVFTAWDAAAATDMEAIATVFDSDRDGALDAGDARFADFFIWKDANQDGVSQEGELTGLAEAGLASIGLVHDDADLAFADGSMLHGVTEARFDDGRTIAAGDYTFAFGSAGEMPLA